MIVNLNYVTGCFRIFETDFRLSNSIINNWTFIDQTKLLWIKFYIKDFATRINNFYEENVYMFNVFMLNNCHQILKTQKKKLFEKLLELFRTRSRNFDQILSPNMYRRFALFGPHCFIWTKNGLVYKE